MRLVRSWLPLNPPLPRFLRPARVGSLGPEDMPTLLASRSSVCVLLRPKEPAHQLPELRFVEGT